MILAAECDPKRRAWGFSINYYKSVVLKEQLQKHKSSFRNAEVPRTGKNMAIATEETKNSKHLIYNNDDKNAGFTTTGGLTM